MIGLLESALVVGAAFAIATWIVVAVFAPRTARKTAEAPALGALAARAWLYAPFWVPGLLVTASFSPKFVGALSGAGDHCLVGGASHNHHLCFLHPPHPSDHLLAVALPLAVGLTIAVFLGICGKRLFREWRLARTLVAISGPSHIDPKVRLLDDEEPLAMTVGWWKPTILLSRGLVATVSPGTLDAILAHECAHVRRRDTWMAALDRLAASLLPRSVAAPLVTRITLAREHACDNIAAESVGGPLTVAKALTEVAAAGVVAPVVGVSIASGSLEARVAYLLEPPEVSLRRIGTYALAGVIVLVLSVESVHLLAERLVTFLLH